MAENEKPSPLISLFMPYGELRLRVPEIELKRMIKDIDEKVGVLVRYNVDPDPFSEHNVVFLNPSSILGFSFAIEIPEVSTKVTTDLEPIPDPDVAELPPEPQDLSPSPASLQE